VCGFEGYLYSGNEYHEKMTKHEDTNKAFACQLAETKQQQQLRKWEVLFLDTSSH
jgi:hypothetical protein